MKRELIRKVTLLFFQDEANGEWGVTHENTCESTPGEENAFNAFWDGEGIFHDVFEHDHEHSEFFRGKYAQNIGGEMAAMGALFYFAEDLQVRRFPAREERGWGYTAASEVARNTTFSYVEDGILNGSGGTGGSCLLSNVPPQPPVPEEESCFESWLDEYVSKVEKLRPRKNRSYDNKDERRYGWYYKNSCTPEKIRDLHRWGYYRARRDFPENGVYWCDGNTAKLNEFIRYWNRFCKINSAEDMATFFKTMTFYVYRKGDGLSWMCVMRSTEGKDIPVHPSIETFGEVFTLSAYSESVERYAEQEN